MHVIQVANLQLLKAKTTIAGKVRVEAAARPKQQTRRLRKLCAHDGESETPTWSAAAAGYAAA